MQTAQQANPGSAVELWIQDEGRIGLKPQLRRVWALKGKRPVIVQKRGYQWLYVYAFVEPRSGKTDFLILPAVSITLMQLALEEFSQKVNPDGEKIIVLLLDGAGWHISKKLKVPPNIVLLHFPPYTPELSPAEPLIRKVKDPVCNQTLNSLPEVHTLLETECTRLMACPDEIRSLCHFHWIRDMWNSL